MDITITFCRLTVKELTQRLQLAFRGGNLPLIKRLSALLSFLCGDFVDEILMVASCVGYGFGF